jgi:hypothetical protein
MITFVSLNTIITDLLSIIRGARLTQSEPISKRQVESWVHQYRARLLKQDLDKGKMPNPDYIQELTGVQVDPIDEVEGVTGIARGEYLLRSLLQIPKTIDLNFKPGIINISTVDGHEIQFIPEGRYKWQKFKRFTSNEPLAFLRNEYIYIQPGEFGIKYVKIRGIFEVPTEVMNFTNTNTTQGSYGLDDPYPIPINIIPTLKEMILKGELGIQVKSWSDLKTDSEAKTEPNVETTQQAG